MCKMAKILLLLLTSILGLEICHAYKLLIVFPFAQKSHFGLSSKMVKYLLESGHEITFITPFLINEPHTNLTQVDVSEIIDYFKVPASTYTMDYMMDNTDDRDINVISLFNTEANQIMFKLKNVQKLLYDSEQQFDLIIAQWVQSELVAGFSAVYNCPYIWFCSVEPHWAILRLIDDTTNPTYAPHALTSRDVPPYDFINRVNELWIQVSHAFFRNFELFYLEKSIYESILGPVLKSRGRSLPAYEDVIYNASLVLGNSHSSVGDAGRLPENYKSIGGYHIDRKTQPLSPHLQSIMDNAKKGVIYFSLGSSGTGQTFSDKLIKPMLNVFGELEQTVIWKLDMQVADLPPNVHILKWSPQQSILSHPNCVIFITHGGLLSMTEAIHFGIPTIGIPLFADQFLNVQRAVKKGYAIKINLDYMMPEGIRTAIKDMLGNKSYTKKSKELSWIYHHRLLTPDKELVHWVEHVVRTRGAPHLRSPALMVPWYQKMYLDLLALILIVVYVIRTALKRLYSKLYPKKKAPLSKKTN